MATKDNFFQTSDGVWLYFEAKGEGNPIVIIPGFSGNTEDFAPHCEEWSKKYMTVRLDPRSHGRSMKVAGSMRIDRMARDIRELIDHLKLDNVFLMGHSLGGSQVAHYVNHEGAYHLRGAGLADASLYAFSDEDWNEHGCHGYNMDAWLKRMTLYMTDERAYWERGLAGARERMTEEEFQKEIDGACQLPSWAGAEMHLSVYHTDNFTPLKDCTIPMAFFTAHSGYHNAWKSHHVAMERMTKSPLKEMYEYDVFNHGFPYSEKDQFVADVFDFMAKLDALEK